MTKIRHVKVDPWSIIEIRSQYPLGSTDAHLLLTLVLHADWKSRQWEGTQSELGMLACGLSTNTVRKATERLAALGLIQMVAPFRQNARGRIDLAPVYDVVVVPNQTHTRGKVRDQRVDDEAANSSATAQQSRIDRAGLAYDAPIDQAKHLLARREAEKETEQEKDKGKPGSIGSTLSPLLADLAGVGLDGDRAWDPDEPPPWITGTSSVVEK